MSKFAIIPNLYKDPELKLSSKAADVIKNCGGEAVIFKLGTDFEKQTELDFKSFDVAVAIGGDGTILDVAKEAAEYGVLTVGINLGRIGYLASVEKDELEKLSLIQEQKYVIQNRMMISLQYRGKIYNALNDIVISEKKASRMVSVELTADSIPFCDYNSTALIFSTPTGSSGYNVSAGGAVLDPSMECIAITPVCPHTSAMRNFVFTDKTKFSAKNISTPDKNVMISVDGAYDLTLDLNEEVKIFKSDKSAKLISFENDNFAINLMRKMKS